MINTTAFHSACFGFASTPFGKCCMAKDDRGIFSLTFPFDEEFAINELFGKFPDKKFYHDDKEIGIMAQLIFQRNICPALNFYGSDFQKTVWEALLKIPFGGRVSYEEIAISIGMPKAVRSVAHAIACNPIAFLVPCHRVIRKNGSIGEFRWGRERKVAMLEWEEKILNLEKFQEIE